MEELDWRQSHLFQVLHVFGYRDMSEGLEQLFVTLNRA